MTTTISTDESPEVAKPVVAAPTKTTTTLKGGQKLADLSPELLQEIKEAFEMFDTENQGFMETTQLKFAMRGLGFEPKKEEIKKLTAEVDKEKTGKIDFDTFASLMARKLDEKGTREEILKAFQLFDEDNTGKISFENLKKVSEELGEAIADEELREMIAEADRDGDGQVDREEFLRIMKKTCLY